MAYYTEWWATPTALGVSVFLVPDLKLTQEQVGYLVLIILGSIIAVGTGLLKRWLGKQLEALDRIPPKEWFEEVSRVMRARSTREEVDRLNTITGEHTKKLDNFDYRVDKLELDARTEHKRISDVRDDVERIKVHLELDR